MNSRPLAASALLLCLTIPATADGVLEQIENEVAAITQRTRSAVVTIEDSRALMVSYATSPLEKNDIAARLQRLTVEQQQAQTLLNRQEDLLKQGFVPQSDVNEARYKLERVTAERAAEAQRLEQFGRLSPIQRLIQETEVQKNLLTLDERAQMERKALVEQRLKAGIVPQSEVDAADASLQMVRADLKSVQERLDSYNQLLKANADAQANLRGAAQVDARNVYTLTVNQINRASTQSPRSGTGFSIGDGFIVTTADVLTGMSNPVVVTDNGTKIRASVMGVDTERNVGLLKLVALAVIPSLKLGDSSKAVPGHFAISIGNQHGSANAVALTLIASIRTEGTYAGQHFYPSLIQIGGTVGAGTSGAPLVDSHGEVIGIMAGVPQSDEGAQVGTNPFGANNAANPNRRYYMNSGGTPLNPTNYVTSTTSNTPWNENTPFLYGFAPTRFVDSTKPLARSKPQDKKAVTKPGAKPRAKAAPKAGSTQSTRDKATFRALELSRNRSLNFTLNTPAQMMLNNRSSFVNLSPDVTTQSQTAFVGQPIYAFNSAPPVVSSAGFAIPVNDIQNVLADLKAGKPVNHGWIGVDLEDQEQANEKDGIVTVLRTVMIKGFYANSPAQRDGLQPGDLILSINDHKIQTIADLRATMANVGVGQTANMLLQRGQATIPLQVKIDARPTITGTPILNSAPTK